MKELSRVAAIDSGGRWGIAPHLRRSKSAGKRVAAARLCGPGRIRRGPEVAELVKELTAIRHDRLYNCIV